MYEILLTQNSTPVFKYIVKVLGYVMEGIFWVLDKIGIPNVGLAIILFTIVVNLCMLPLTYKQQKFSKMSQIMNPEIKALQKKYEGKKDQQSQVAMNSEMQAIYAKYGVSPTGSCLFLLIQMPILFALYRVIYQIPAYVGKIGNTFKVLADKIIATDNGQFILDATKDNMSSVASAVSTYTKNINADLGKGIIDVLNKTSSADMATLADNYDLSTLQYNGHYILTQLDSAGNVIQKGLIDTYNTFLGLNIVNSPWNTMKTSFASVSENGFSAVLMGIGAILIPVLAGLTQWINMKLTPQPNANVADGQSSQMNSSMKIMNNMMPLMSIWFGFTLPAGMGLYWIASAVVRGIIMVIMNKKIDKMNIDDLIKKNSGKAAKKMAKRQATQEKLNAYANMKTKNISSNANQLAKENDEKNGIGGKNDNSINKSRDSYSRFQNISEKSSKVSDKDSPVTSGSGSMLSKANAVKEFNEKNNK